MGCGASGLWRALVGVVSPQEEITCEGRRFRVVRQLGEGGFAFVYLVREVPDTRGEDFALKRLILHEEEHVQVGMIWFQNPELPRTSSDGRIYFR